MPFRHLVVLVVPYLFLGAAGLGADAPFRYPAGKHGPAELRYVNGVPVLSVAGTPAEIGDQVAALAAKPGRRMLDYPQNLLDHYRMGFTWGAFVQAGRRMYEHFPDEARQELEAMIRTSGYDRDRMVTGNVMFDLKKVIACSTLAVDPERSATGAPLLGRNLDFPTLGYLQDYSLVTVYRPKGKHAFAAVGFPGLIGCLSGMNDAGLALAVLEVNGVKDGEERFNPKGRPYMLCYRQLLEECTTIEEALKLLRTLPRATATNLAVCDRRGGGVFEVTPGQVLLRRGTGGCCICTNHFCCPEVRPEKQATTFNTLGRFAILGETQRQSGRLTVEDVRQRLHAVHQGKATLQTMVFEPATLRLHLAVGKTPTTALPLKTLELAELFKAPAAAEAGR